VGSRVKPRLSRGLRDLLPEQMGARQRLIDTIRGVYERYGFAPLATPAIEYLEVLSGSEAGAETQKQIFTVSNPEREELGLRFDLTVPLARVVAQYRDLPRPFRRYQVGSVWRADKPDPGRFREFTQFDIDAVGVPGEVADAEIIAATCDALRALRVGAFRVRFSSRRVLNLLLPFAGIPAERGPNVFRVLDKLEKIGAKKLRLELTTGYEDESGDRIPGLGLESSQVDFFTNDQLRYLEACLLETCRLFPPVTNTFHATPNGGSFGGSSLPAGVDIIHYFPANNRDTVADPSADDFRPERWLDPAQNAQLDYPNLFLSGPRACPGKDLILFICKAALAVMLIKHRLTIESPSLAGDPLPFSFPTGNVHISTRRCSR